jgi:hypothetical protein
MVHQQAAEIAYDDTLTPEQKQLAVAELYAQPPQMSVAPVAQAPAIPFATQQPVMTEQPVVEAGMSPAQGFEDPAAAMSVGVGEPQAQPVGPTPIQVGGAQAGPGQMVDPTGAVVQQLIQDELSRTGGPARRIKGGAQLTQFKLDKGPELTPEHEAQLREQAGRSAALEERSGMLAAETRAAQAEQEQAQAERVGNQLIDFQVAQQKAKGEVEAQRQRVDQLAEDAKYNPRAFWQDKDTFGTMQGVLGLMLMGIGGKADQAIKIVEDFNKQDMDFRADRTDRAQNKLDELAAGVLNPAAMQEYSMGIKLKQAAFEMEGMASMMHSRELQQQAFIEAEKVRQAGEERIMNANMQEMGSRTEQYVQVPDRVTGGAGSSLDRLSVIAKKLGISPIQALDLATKGQLPISEAEQKAMVEKQKNYVPGEGFAFTPTAADKARAVTSSRDTIHQLVGQMRTILNRKGTESAFGDDFAKLQSLSKALTLEQKTASELGALSGPDMDLVQGLWGDPTSLWTKGKTAITQLDSGLQYVDNGSNNKLNAYIEGRGEKQAVQGAQRRD